MIKIKSVQIERYRSIVNLKLEINSNNGFITICGENNTGKTNTLRAVDLFFNPEKYKPEIDIPFHKLEGSRGGATFPKISIEFIQETDNESNIYKIERSFDLNRLLKTTGKKSRIQDRKKSGEEVTPKEIDSFLDKIRFFFIESINISFPNLINKIIEDVYDIEYQDTRFSGAKDDLKNSFEKYTQGLLAILKRLSNDINPLFKDYRENWGVDFDVDIDIKRFRDLISDEIIFFINDGSNKNIGGKGSGLQKLAYILLHYRIIQKIKSKSVIFLIDEPDAYLHQGLQKKLLKHLKDITNKSQILITTHSPIFIDSYTLDNVFLLELEISPHFYERRKREYNIMNTKVVELNQIDGTQKIRSYLGIENIDHEIIHKYNIVVEGESDKIYIETFCKFFDLPDCNIIPANGADNIIKYLDFYNSYYSSVESFKPYLLILLDNDIKGREVYSKIKPDKYQNIKVSIEFIPNFLGEVPSQTNSNKVSCDWQIEDFIYPKLIVDLVNKILEKNQLIRIDAKSIDTKINQAAFKNRGILNLLESQKNEKNPHQGQCISFISSQYPTEQIKTSLATLFKKSIPANVKTINLLREGDSTYPKVKEFLSRISNLHNFIQS